MKIEIDVEKSYGIQTQFPELNTAQDRELYKLVFIMIVTWFFL
jgi:hypothetical protein